MKDKRERRVLLYRDRERDEREGEGQRGYFTI